MFNHDKLRRDRLKESIESHCKASIEEKISRYLEIEHQGIIAGHYFANASSECIYLYRDGYFVGAVMMSHAINEGIIKFIAERNSISRCKDCGNTKTVEELISEFKEDNIITKKCADASMKILKSFRADIHHMNPTVKKIPFQKLAQQNLKHLSTIEREIFGYEIKKDGAIAPYQTKYWDINPNGTATVFLRL
jgi:hypothetical protein